MARRDARGRFVTDADFVLERAVLEARRVIVEADDVVIREHSGRVVHRYRDFDRGYVLGVLSSAAQVAELLGRAS